MPVQIDRRTLLRHTALAGSCAIVGLAPVVPASAKVALAIGRPAPDFTGQDADGRSVKLSDLKGQTVVLEWSNHDCPYVVKHYSSGTMQAVQKDAMRDGVVWLTIISSAPGEEGNVTAAQANQLTRSRNAAPSNVVLDPEGRIARQYEARTTPHMFIVDKAGLLQYMGGIDDKPTASTRDLAGARPYVRLALAALAKGEKVAEAITRPYGCSVKYKSS